MEYGGKKKRKKKAQILLINLISNAFYSLFDKIQAEKKRSPSLIAEQSFRIDGIRKKKKKKKKKGKKKARSRDTGAHRKGGLGTKRARGSILSFPSSEKRRISYFSELSRSINGRPLDPPLPPPSPPPIQPRVAKQWFPSRTGAVQPAQCGKLRWLRTTWTPPFVEPLDRGGRKEFLRACQPFVIANGSRLTKVS